MSQSKFRVSEKASLGLNLRSEPVVKDSNKKAVLPMGQVVTKIAESATPGWWEVSTTLDGAIGTGFVNSKFLVPDAEFAAPPPVSSITAVHLSTTNKITRNGTGRAFPLNETGQPTRNSSGTPEEKAKQLTAIVKWLDVENKARYGPTSSVTYCNIYAYDYCYLAGVYLPRVWWREDAIAKLRAGKPVEPIYAKTVDEINANSLVTWFSNYGSTFGWRRTLDLTELQNAANDGQAVIICAQHKVPNHHGHICAVVPEISTQKAVRSGATVTKPLQSQAGGTNRKYFASTWWLTNHKNFGFWINAS
jgi:hypothetical protein